MSSILTSKKHLFTRISIGFALGILMGILLPGFSIQTKFVGDIYLNLIQMMIIPVIFVAVSGGIINIGSTEDLGRIGLKSVVVFVLMFIATAAIGLIISYIVRPGNHINIDSPGYDEEVTSPSVQDFFMNIVPDNIFQAISEEPYFLPYCLLCCFLLQSSQSEKKLNPSGFFSTVCPKWYSRSLISSWNLLPSACFR